MSLPSITCFMVRTLHTHSTSPAQICQTVGFGGGIKNYHFTSVHWTDTSSPRSDEVLLSQALHPGHSACAPSTRRRTLLDHRLSCQRGTRSGNMDLYDTEARGRTLQSSSEGRQSKAAQSYLLGECQPAWALERGKNPAHPCKKPVYLYDNKWSQELYNLPEKSTD